MNAGKFKVMLGSSGGKMIVNTEKWPCDVCGKGLQATSVQYTVCKKWIHKRCSGVRGGETYCRCVKSFCYLGDSLGGDGGADLSATARVSNG